MKLYLLLLGAEAPGRVVEQHDYFFGIEENLAALPGLVSRADAAFFPMDCISHSAAGQIKKCCRDGHKPFIPLRTASVASFAAAIGHRDVLQNGRLPRV